MTFRTPNAASA